MQVVKPRGPLGLPNLAAALLAPMALTKQGFERPLIGGQGMADRRQQGKQLGRAAIFHRRSREQPNGPQAWMARQPHQGLATAGGTVLGVMGLIGNQHRARRRQGPGQLGPTVELDGQAQGRRLPTPMQMQAHGGQHHNPAIGKPDHGSGGHQGREGFAEAHGIRQHSPPARQQPADPDALVGKQGASIGQRTLQIRRGHQPAMERQRGQGLLHPGEPFSQLGLHREAASEGLQQGRRRFQGKLPTAPAG